MPTPVDTYIEELKGFEFRVKELVADGDKRTKEEINTEIAKWTPAIQEAQKAAQDYKRSLLTSMDDYGRLTVGRGKFGGLTAIELAILRHIFLGRARYGPDAVKASIWAELDEARKSLRQGISPVSVERWATRSMEQRVKMAGVASGTPGGRLFERSINGWRMDMLQQIQKAMDSTTAGAGDELVSTLEAAELWMDVNLETKILPLFVQSPMPSNPFIYPAQLGDTNWYPTTENVQLASTTDVATAKATMTAYGLKTGVPFSDELEEDSIVAWVPELRASLARNAAEIIDDILMNADTTSGTTNINYDGGNLTTTVAGFAQYLLGFDGLVHLPYVDNTGQRTRQQSALANTSYNNALVKLGKYAAPGRRGDVVFIAPINVALKTMTLAQVETIEKYGPRATISSGEISSIYGTPLIISEQFLLSDTTGEIRTVTSNNTAGRILAVNTTQWRTGFRRQITFEPDREPGKSQTTLYVSFRIAFVERTGTRSTATHTGLIYDITL